MCKSPEAFRTISEVAELLETPTHVLRFWETRFPQIHPLKRAGGRRYYRPQDIALLGGIRQLLREDGLTIRGVQKILREQGVQHVVDLGQPVLPCEELTNDEMTAAPENIAFSDGSGDAVDHDEALRNPEPVLLSPIFSTKGFGARIEAGVNQSVDGATTGEPGRQLDDTAAPCMLQPLSSQPTLASRIRALPMGSLAPRHSEIFRIATRMSALQERLLAAEADSGLANT